MRSIVTARLALQTNSSTGKGGVMKPFNIEEAKAGKPVQTRDGRDVEILKFDLRGKYPLVVIIKNPYEDNLLSYTNEGLLDIEHTTELFDLKMKSEPKQGWVAVLEDGKLTFNIYHTKEEAETIGGTFPNFVAVAKIEWEE